MSDDDGTPVLMCMPVDQTLMVQLGLPTIEPYADSTKTRCQACRREVWIGPRQRKQREQRPEIRVGCYFCIVQVTQAPGAESRMIALSQAQTTLNWPFRRN